MPSPQDRPRDRLGRPRRPGEAHALAAHDAALRACGSVDEAFALGCADFEAERYFEAHECFEWIWHSSEIAPAERSFWRALAQTAAGCCHLQRGNPRGAAGVLSRARGELARWGRAPFGIDAAALNATLGRLLDALREGSAGSALDFPRLTLRPEK